MLEKYSENRCKFPLDKLAEYSGQWVAWSGDGSHIVAHHEEFPAVLHMLQAAGIDLASVVLSSIPPREEAQLE